MPYLKDFHYYTQQEVDDLVTGLGGIYIRQDGTTPLAGAWSMGNFPLTNVNIDSGVITGITDLLPEDGGTGMGVYVVGDLIYASGVATLSRLADVVVGQVLVSGGVGVAPAWSGSPYISGLVTLGDNLLVSNGYVMTSAGSGSAYASKLSTAYTFPYVDTFLDSIGGTSWEGRLCFRTSSAGGALADRMVITNDGIVTIPNTLSITTLTTGYVPYHVSDAAGLANSNIFYDGTNVGVGTAVPGNYKLAVFSADYRAASFSSSYGQVNIDFMLPGVLFGSVGSGNSMTATATSIDFGFGTTGHATSNIVFATGAGYVERMRISSVGIVSMPAVYAHDMNGETYRDLLINSSGELGYDSSTIRKKTKVRDMEDTSWIYDLRPVNFEFRVKDSESVYLKRGTGEKRYGLIAEEVERLCPEMVFYDEEGQIEGIHKKEFIFPLINEVQKLRKEIDELRRIK